MTTAVNRTSASGPRSPIVSADEIRARLGHSIGRTDTAATPASSARPLTSRESDVVRGVVAGLGNDQIARRLGISRWTVVNHLRRVMQKWGCSTRVEVAVHFSTLPHGLPR